MCRVNFDMSVKLSSITTAATKFNFGKSNLYDFIFFKSCHFITFCISSLLHHWVSPSTLSRTNFLQTILSSLFFWWYLRVEETWSLHFWMPESEFGNVTPLFFTFIKFTMVKNDVSDETKNLLVIKIKRSLAEFFYNLCSLELPSEMSNCIEGLQPLVSSWIFPWVKTKIEQRLKWQFSWNCKVRDLNLSLSFVHLSAII